MTKTFSLKELSQLTNSKLHGDPDLRVSAVDGLETAGEGDVSFLANPKYGEVMLKSKAGLICVDENTKLIDGMNFLISDDPSRAFQKIAEQFIANKKLQATTKGIHPSAVIHETAKIAENVNIGPLCVVEKDAVIKEGTTLFGSTFVGPNVTIGNNCMIHAGVTIREFTVIGNQVTIQPGAVIGSCGFGFTTDENGNHHKLEQIGNVIVEDNVEIGANTTIDRARFKSTIIGKGTMIDNLVQIAHNVTLGQNNIIVSQTGIAGSSKFGKNVFCGGQVGVVGHLEITDNVMIATRGGVSKSIKTPGVYGGSPVSPMADFNKQQVYARKLEKFVKKIALLEKKVAELENKS